MRYDPEEQHRRSVRLPEYDYSAPGAYFVTICAYSRQCLFGRIEDGIMHLNGVGLIVQSCWSRLATRFCWLTLDEYVIMPNHLHGIIHIEERHGLGRGEAFAHQNENTDQVLTANASPLQPRGTQPQSLPAIVQAFKSSSARRINQRPGQSKLMVWQRNYYEHIIQDEKSLNRIREYIHVNPTQWLHDPDNLGI